MTSLRGKWPFQPDPDASSVPVRQMGPRCGQVMRRYEGVWGPLLDDVTCGRLLGHNGRHRSVQSLDKERDRKRWVRYSEKQRQKRRRETLARALRETDGYGSGR